MGVLDFSTLFCANVIVGLMVFRELTDTLLCDTLAAFWAEKLAARTALLGRTARVKDARCTIFISSKSSDSSVVYCYIRSTSTERLNTDLIMTMCRSAGGRAAAGERHEAHFPDAGSFNVRPRRGRIQLHAHAWRTMRWRLPAARPLPPAAEVPRRARVDPPSHGS